MARKRRILLSGYYGQFNTGDDALAYAIVKRITASDPEAELVVLSPVRLVLPPAPQLRFDHSERIRVLRRILWRLAVLNTDALVRGGGGILFHHSRSRPRPVNLVNIRRGNSFAKALGKSVHLVGISAGPIEGDEAAEQAREIVAAADFISVRDSESTRALHALGVPLDKLATCLDPAILLLEDMGQGLRHSPTKDMCIGVALRPVFSWMERDSAKDQAYVKSLARALTAMLCHYSTMQIRLFVFHRGATHDRGDEQITSELQAQLSPYASQVSVVPYHPDPRHALSEIARCSHVFAVRYHAAVFAYMARVPFIIVDYQWKCRGFATDIGLHPDCLVHLHELTDPSILTDKVVRLVRLRTCNVLDVREALTQSRACIPTSILGATGC